MTFIADTIAIGNFIDAEDRVTREAAGTSGYQKELGPNAYAVFNTLTDIAARPPESAYFQKDLDTIEKRSVRWLKELARQSKTKGFNLNAWIPAWDAGGTGRQIPGRN